MAEVMSGMHESANHASDSKCSVLIHCHQARTGQTSVACRAVTCQPPTHSPPLHTKPELRLVRLLSRLIHTINFSFEGVWMQSHMYRPKEKSGLTSCPDAAGHVAEARLKQPRAPGKLRSSRPVDHRRASQARAPGCPPRTASGTQPQFG